MPNIRKSKVVVLQGSSELCSLYLEQSCLSTAAIGKLTFNKIGQDIFAAAVIKTNKNCNSCQNMIEVL